MASMADRPDPRPDDHADDHGHDDGDHGEVHAETALGPVDVQRWGAAAVGVLLGLVVVLALVQSLS
jgi:hypothetical protein